MFNDPSQNKVNTTLSRDAYPTWAQVEAYISPIIDKAELEFWSTHNRYPSLIDLKDSIEYYGSINFKQHEGCLGRRYIMDDDITQNAMRVALSRMELPFCDSPELKSYAINAFLPVVHLRDAGIANIQLEALKSLREAISDENVLTLVKFIIDWATEIQKIRDILGSNGRKFGENCAAAAHGLAHSAGININYRWYDAIDQGLDYYAERVKTCVSK